VLRALEELSATGSLEGLARPGVEAARA
jgi:hypothetical protein